MIDSILVPLDGSAFSEASLSPALTISRASGAAVELVHVAEPLSPVDPGHTDGGDPGWGQGYLEKVADLCRSRAGGEVRTALLSGTVRDALLHHADESRAELVVMATHGRGPLARAWLGSVADTVARHTPGPVLLVRPARDGGPGPEDDWPCRRILVPLDGTDHGEAALAGARRLAGFFGARLELVRVVLYAADLASSYLPDTIRISPDVVEREEADARVYLERTVEALRADGFEAVGRVVVDAHVGHAIVEAAKEGGADVVAMVSHGRGGVARALLGSVADKVVRSVDGAVLLQRARPREDAADR